MMVLVTHDVDEAIVLADRIMVMRSHPGRIFEEIPADLQRPRDRHSAAFDHVKARVLMALDRSLAGERVPEQLEHPGTGSAMWW
jgi:sulfonate transport system ATP-binding protein